MTDTFPAQTRRGALTAVLSAGLGAAAGAAALGATAEAEAAEAPALPLHTGGPRDFDFLAGRWTVQHRWLKVRLAGGTEWVECDGTMTLWPTMGGEANIDDNVINRPDGSYRAMSIRAFDGREIAEGLENQRNRPQNRGSSCGCSGRDGAAELKASCLD